MISVKLKDKLIRVLGCVFFYHFKIYDIILIKRTVSVRLFLLTHFLNPFYLIEMPFNPIACRVLFAYGNMINLIIHLWT